MRFILPILLLAFIATPIAVNAAAWTLDKNTRKHFITYRYYSTDEFFDIDGDKRDKNGKFTKNEIEYYTEYGWTPKLTVGMTLAATKEEDKQNFANAPQRILEIDGVTRIEPFLRYQLYRDDLYALAVQPSIKLPSLYTESLPPEAQEDKLEVELAMIGGRNFNLLNRSHYAETKLAYRTRQGQLGDQYIMEGRLGLSLSEDWALMPEIQYTRSVDDVRRNFSTLSGSNDYNLLKGQVSLLYSINDKTSIQLGAFKHLDGDNTGAGGGGLVSLWLTF